MAVAASEMVSELMRQPVVTVGPDAKVQKVLALARSKGVHHIPVVKDGRLLGLVCTCDLDEASPSLPVLNLARRNVVTASPDASLGEAARLMMAHAVGSVIISNRDGIWGIVTRTDLVQAGPELAALLADGQCAACGVREHLRQGPGETYLCASCADQANSHHWYDADCGS